ncbi:MAG: pilus assembly protein N-terminal domain-containing protein [Pseudobdellovibrionaceae bacterium]
MTHIRPFKTAFTPFLAAALILLSALHAHAAEPSEGDLLPVRGTEVEASQDQKTTRYPDLSLTPDKPYVLTIDADASNIIVGNTDHLEVVPDSTRRMVLVPRKPGTTYLQIVDDAGNLIMERHVIIGVAKPAERYVRIRRSCNGDSKNCESTSVYYCPGMCHRMDISGADVKGPDAPVSGRYDADEDVNAPIENSTELGNNAPASPEPQ